ncbi:hypothetical protein HFN_0554 [Helicobacter fennelliae MRY12-0050]|uniref:Uncharacterized protein n=1 Tax=Helicobacter fennelliae MRY12-0050 TaxID=1325130 RepID=T1DWA1_9HELI|nr:hypothetical protein HFN_0554 [Helicobacter fennelliae MRY12-0050]
MRAKSSLFCYAFIGLCLRSHISGSLKFLACKPTMNAYVTLFYIFCLTKNFYTTLKSV